MCQQITYKRQTAFTLAEVLITLLIIGVIASIVIPGLIADTQNAEYKTAWKKAFADFSQAARKMTADNGGNLGEAFPGGGTAAGHTNFRNGFLPYLNYIKACTGGNAYAEGCWHNSDAWYTSSGSPLTGHSAHVYSGIVLNNGTLVSMYLYSTACNYNYTYTNDTCGLVLFDINGFKGPNKVGTDIFGSHVLRNGVLLPYGTSNDVFYSSAIGWNKAATYLYQ